MTRSTSIESYNTIKANGLLSSLRFTVYDCIFHSGPLTQGECVDILQSKLDRGNNSGTIASRFAELKNLGVIEETCKRPCKITGRTCLEWAVTGSLPVEFTRVSKDQVIRDLQEQLNALQVILDAKNRELNFLKSRTSEQLTLFKQAS